MKFKGTDEAKKQAKQVSENLTKATQGFKSLLENLTNQLSKEELQDYKSYKNTPEGRKQAAIFEKIKKGVSEVMDNIPKQ